jgi:hypothetical protein
MSKTVYVPRWNGSGQPKYHTDPECRGLKDAELRETTKQEAEAWDKDHCKYCSGEYQPTAPTHGGKSKLERILEAQDE